MQFLKKSIIYGEQKQITKIVALTETKFLINQIDCNVSVESKNYFIKHQFFHITLHL